MPLAAASTFWGSALLRGGGGGGGDGLRRSRSSKSCGGSYKVATCSKDDGEQQTQKDREDNGDASEDISATSTSFSSIDLDADGSSSNGAVQFAGKRTYAGAQGSLEEYTPLAYRSDSLPRRNSTTNPRAGLTRTPITGGVQSATSTHDLPSPAVAVRNLVERARYAHLCTIMSKMHHRRRGFPFGSLVDFTTDPYGHPLFLLSPLAIHTRNVMADPRVSVVVQMPGWSGLANARATLFGDVVQLLPGDDSEVARTAFGKKHRGGDSRQWGNFSFFRMARISDIYFVGGFGTVTWINVNEYLAATPDPIAAHDTDELLQDLNLRYGKQLCQLVADVMKEPADDVQLISIDRQGVDVRVRRGAAFHVTRLRFDRYVDTPEDAEQAVKHLASSSGAS
eukprot:jgi/Chlat1/8980/Chrsp94S08267